VSDYCSGVVDEPILEALLAYFEASAAGYEYPVI